MSESKLRRLRRDVSAGATTALVTIPDGMASALLAGLNPVHGLYALMVGTPVAAVVATSRCMYVANNGGIAVATGSVIANFTGDEFDPDPEGRARIFRSLDAPRQVGALLFLDRPQGLEGHGAGADARFTQRYGACLLDFAEGRASRC